METPFASAILRALGQVAPGSPLREGLDRVLQSGRGGLIVIGDNHDVLNICSGGFLLDAAFTPQRLSELAKMDGAIILADDASRIARANVHLVPNPNVPTGETGTRHRTAERVARSLNVPVIAVSESRKEIQVYVGDQRHPLATVGRLLDRSNQAIQTLERFRNRLAGVATRLTALEVEDTVSPRDVFEVLQRTEMVARISSEIERNLIELGSDGRLVRLQADELLGGMVDDRRAIIRDYFCPVAGVTVDDACEAMAALDDVTLLDDEVLRRTLHLPPPNGDVEQALHPRGYRVLARIPRLSEEDVDVLIERFGNLEAVLSASKEDLEEVPGFDDHRARLLKNSLGRMVERALDRYQSR